MKIVRIILACLLAFAVATLPAASAFALAKGGMVGEEAAASSGMASMAMSPAGDMADCRDHTKVPCHDGKMSGCASTSMCTLKCFNFFALDVAHIAFPLILSMDMPTLADSTRPIDTGSSPFRPPRV